MEKYTNSTHFKERPVLAISQVLEKTFSSEILRYLKHKKLELLIYVTRILNTAVQWYAEISIVAIDITKVPDWEWYWALLNKQTNIHHMDPS